MPKHPPMKPRRAWMIVDPKGTPYPVSIYIGTRKGAIELWLLEDNTPWESYAAEGWTRRRVRIEEVKQ